MKKKTVKSPVRFCWDCGRKLQSGKGVAVVIDGRACWVHAACANNLLKDPQTVRSNSKYANED